MKKIICLITFVLVTIASAQLPVYNCKQLNPGESITIDGRLSETEWTRADTIRLVDVITGVPQNKYPTKVLALWDTSFLYIGFEVTDDSIRNTLTQHDASLYQQDVVEIFMDPSSDELYYYELEWNCTNTMFDCLIASAPGKPLPPDAQFQFDLGWDTDISKSAVMFHGTPNNNSDRDTGLTFEIAIAWRDLNKDFTILPPKEGDTHRMNFYRIEYRNGSTIYTAWSPTGVTPAQFHKPDKFGIIKFASSSSTKATQEIQTKTVNNNTLHYCMSNNRMILKSKKSLFNLLGSRISF